MMAKLMINNSRTRALLIKIIIALALLSEIKTEDFVTKAIRFCPVEQECISSTTENKNTEKSCCKLCDCDASCWQRRSCCHDAEQHAGTSDVHQEVCIAPTYPTADDTRTEDTKIGSFEPGYLVTDICPKDYDNTNVIAKCSGLEPTRLLDVAIVPSKDGLFNYKNQYCAECNGIDEYLVWDIHLDWTCIKIANSLGITGMSLETFCLSRCLLKFKKELDLATDTRVTSDICYTHTIASCNITGRWVNYDKELEHLCMQSSDSLPYRHIQIFKATMQTYSNVFCFLCNVPSSVEPQTCTPDNRYNTRFEFTSFTALLDLSSVTTNEDKISRCGADEMFDDFFEVCRRLYCPLLELPMNGKCVSYSRQTLSQGFGVGFTLMPRQSLILPDGGRSFYPSPAIQFVSSIQKKLGFGHCGRCRADVVSKRNINETEMTNVTEMTVYLSLYTVPNCQKSDILSTAARFDEDSIDITIKVYGIGVTFSISRDHGNFQQKTRMGDTYAVLAGIGSACGVLGTKKIDNCPKVELSKQEFDTAMASYPHLKTYLTETISVNDSVFVCCDDYKGRSDGVVYRDIRMVHVVAIYLCARLHQYI